MTGAREKQCLGVLLARSCSEHPSADSLAVLRCDLPGERKFSAEVFHFFKGEFVIFITFTAKLKYMKQTLPCRRLWAYGEKS